MLKHTCVQQSNIKKTVRYSIFVSFVNRYDTVSDLDIDVEKRREGEREGCLTANIVVFCFNVFSPAHCDYCSLLIVILCIEFSSPTIQ